VFAAKGTAVEIAEPISRKHWVRVGIDESGEYGAPLAVDHGGVGPNVHDLVQLLHSPDPENGAFPRGQCRPVDDSKLSSGH
jgi:hypothetical protein